MLREYSKIAPSKQALKSDRIVRWKGEKKVPHYVSEISVGLPYQRCPLPLLQYVSGECYPVSPR